MDNTELIVNTNFGTVDYCVAVEAIANGYFSDLGEYSPQLGIINTMALFYNFCVKQSEFDEEFEHNIKDLVNVDKLIADNEFMAEYNKAINDTSVIKLNFGNAYKDALKIIDDRKGNINTVIRFVGNLFQSALQELSTLISGDNDVVTNIVNTLNNKNENTDNEKAENDNSTESEKDLKE